MPNPNIKPTYSTTKTDATLDQALTSFLTVNVRNYERFFFRIAITVQATDQFQIDVKPYQAGSAVTIAGPTTATDFTSPNLPLVFASEDLASITAGSTAYAIMDVRGLEEVDLKLAFAGDNGTYVIDYGLQ